MNKAQFLAVGTILPLTLVQAEETLHVVKVEKAPTVDGTTEEIWDNIPETVISLARIPQQLVDANKQYQKGKYTKKWQQEKYTKATKLRLKAARSNDKIFFLARWQDDSKDDLHKPWKWEGDKASGEYLSGKEREDRFAFMFPISGKFSSNKLSGNEMVADVWQWKAARTNPVGIIHDKSHIVSKDKPKGKSALHYTAAGEAVYVSRPGDGPSPYKSNKIDPFTHQGDVISRYIPTKPDHPDAIDVQAKGVWSNNNWIVEIGRKLDTGNPATDIRFDTATETYLAAAVFNHAGDHFHAVSSVIKVVFDN